MSAIKMNRDWRSILFIFLPVYLAANLYLLLRGQTTYVFLLLGMAVLLGLLSWLTTRLTRPTPVERVEAGGNKVLLWAQLGILAVVMVLTGLNASGVPLWSGMVAWLRRLGESALPVEWFGGPGNAVANPVQYFVIPFILLLLLGAKPAALGLGKGNKVWRVCLIWLALPLVIWVVLLATGSLGAQALVRRIISNSFQNGFFEEFLFRGALQTRLRRLVSAPWALVLQALVFGLWHLRANIEGFGGELWAGLAACIVSQGLYGLAFGYLFQRTRNLIAPSVAHVAVNVMGQTLG